MIFVAGVLLVVVHCTEFSIHMFPLVFLPFLHSFFAFRARFRILSWPLVFLLFPVNFQNKIGNPPSFFCSLLLLFLFTFRIHSLTCAGIRNGKFWGRFWARLGECCCLWRNKCKALQLSKCTVKYGSKWEHESWYIDGRAQEFGFRLSACSREDR